MKVGVVGAGVIGVTVAHALLEAEHDVVLIDTDPEAIDGARTNIHSHARVLRMHGAAGRAHVSIDEMMSRLSPSRDYAVLNDADLVIENVTEELAAKLAVHRILERVCVSRAIFAANTSAIPIAAIAEASQRPDRVMGIHFMNPVSLIPMVEVITTAQTSDHAILTVSSLLESLGKSWVVVGDSPGFVINRILMLMINEAAKVVAEGVATAENADRLFQGCLGHRMGPLRTADLIGLDTIVRTLRVLEQGIGCRFAPAPHLIALVSRGHLGRKSAQGFYHYG